MKTIYILAAAGIGKRMGLDYPKQFLEFDNEPIFIKSLKTLSNSSVIDEIIIVTNKEYIEKVKNLVKDFNIKKIRAVISGGKERQDSIYNAIKTINNIHEYYVGIHDGVRPFIQEKHIIEAWTALETEKNIDGVVIAVPVKDTIKIINKNGFVEETPNRNNLISAQTPQIFRGAILKKAYEFATKEKFLGTDDSSLVENINGAVKYLEGAYDNVKITTVEDLLHFHNRG